VIAADAVRVEPVEVGSLLISNGELMLLGDRLWLCAEPLIRYGVIIENENMTGTWPKNGTHYEPTTELSNKRGLSDLEALLDKSSGW